MNQWSQAEKPHRNWLEQLRSESKGVIESAIKDARVAAWYLERVFLFRPDLNEALQQHIVQHTDCPESVLALFHHIKPEWVESSEAMARIRLACMEPEFQQLWEKALKSSGLAPAESVIDTLYDGYYQAVARCLVYSGPKSAREQGVQDFLDSCPRSIILYFCALDRRTDAEFLFDNCSASLELVLARNGGINLRKELAKRSALAIETQQVLAQDKYLSVRKAIASNAACAPEVLQSLVASGDEKIMDTIAGNKSASEALLQRISASRKQAATGRSKKGSAKSVPALLKLLADLRLDKKSLMDMACHENAAVRSMVAHHPNATQAILDKVMASPERWVKAAAAQYTQNTADLVALAVIDDFDIELALASNSALPAAERLIVASNTQSDAVRRQLASVFIDDRAVIDVICTGRKSASPWAARLRMALNPNTPRGALTSLHRSMEFRYLAISKAIARHPNCSDALVSLFRYYLSDEIVKRELAQEGKKKISKRARENGQYAEWKLNQQFSDRAAHACVINFYLSEESKTVDEKTRQACQRKALSCRFLDVSRVARLALEDDSHTLRRFVRKDNPHRFPQYVYEVLAYNRLATVRKQLVDVRWVSSSLVLQLCADKDKSVQMAALKVAKKRKLKLTDVINVSPAGKSRAGALGNKAARLDLVASTNDLSLLTTLAADKTRDVRCKVAQHKLLDDSLLAVLLEDDDLKVQEAAVGRVPKRTVSDQFSERIDKRLIALITSGESNLARTAARGVSSLSALSALYPTGNSSVDNVIVRRTDDIQVMEKAMFNSKRSNDTSLAYALFDNETMSGTQIAELVKIQPKLLSRLSRCMSPEATVNFVKQGKIDTLSTGALSAELSAEQIRELLALNEQNISLVYRQVHKLETTELLELIASSKKLRQEIAENDHLAPEIVSVLRTYKKFSIHDSLCGYPMTRAEIENYLTDAWKKMWSNIAECQQVTAEEELKLADTKSCRESLIYRDVYRGEHRESLRVATLEKLVKLGDSHVRSMARAQLIARDVEPLTEQKDKVTGDESLNLTDSLGLHQAPFAAAEANRLLMQLGILVEVIEYDSPVKKLSKTGREFGVEDSDGDSTIVYFQDKFDVLLGMMLEQKKAA